MASAAAPASVVPLSAARPVIEVDGTRLARAESALLSMALADGLDTMANAELVLGNWGGERPGFQWFGRDVLDFGKQLAVKLGGETLFDGRITAIGGDYPDGGPPTLTLLAEDRLQDLRMVRRTRSFAATSLADVARAVAADHGLSADIDIDAVAQASIAQVNQSDLALLHDLARREDAAIWVEGATLKLARRRTAPRVALAWAGSLREFSVLADLAGQATALVAGGWDVATRSAASHRADAAAVAAETGSGDSGAAILARALGERVATCAHALPRNSAEARAIAEGQFRRQARRFVTGEGVAQTSAALRPGAVLALSGLGPLFDGDHHCTRVVHRFDADAGLRSEFACERAVLGRAG
jgi:phage protein D